MEATTMHPSARRSLAFASAAALALSLMPIGPASAQTAPEPRGIDRVCPAPEDAAVPDAPEPEDVAGATHEESITCALEYGLVQGFADGSYGPGTPVTRGQMATFVANWLETAGNLDLGDAPETTLTDVAGTTHADAVDALVDIDVVSGRADGTFGPNDAVTRGQMARFVRGAIDYADTLEVNGSLPPADETDHFDDVAGTTFEAEIRAIAGVGIVQGVGDDLYAPNAAVTRGQLATFLMSGADYLDRHQRWEPTSVIVEYQVALSGGNEVDDSGTEPAFGAGEPDATGTATLTIDAYGGEIDVELLYDQVTGPFGDAPGAHIHVGDIDENGPIVVPLATGADLEGGGGTFATTVDEDVDSLRFADLIEDPDAFYVNVHSNDFPPGAIRGQLPDGGQQLLEPTTFTVTMTGEAEVDTSGQTPTFGAGEDGATAEATVEIDYVAREVDFTVDVSGVTGPFDAAPGFHIHVGEEDENGPIVVFLTDGAAVQAAATSDGILSGTLSDVAPDVLRAIVDDPSGYYVNLHSDAFPAGAVRAQLG